MDSLRHSGRRKSGPLYLHEQSEWYPDLDDIEKKISDRTKAIVIINPNNPTGALYPEEILQKIVDIARRHQLIIFSDEIYDRLVMDGEKHISIASLAPDLFCVTFSGLSKSHMIAGYRIGWMTLKRQQKHVKDYIEGIQYAIQYASVLQCTGSVYCTGRIGIPDHLPILFCF